MKQPSLDNLMQKVDSKYTLVVLTAKRARAITEGALPYIETQSKKPVSIAMEEVANDKVKYERTKTGIK